MKAPNKELRQFVYDRLYNAITYGTVIPVSSVPAKSQTFPFIDLGNISLTDERTKTHFLTRAQLEINIYTQFADENTSYTPCEEISSMVLQRLIDYIGTTTNFKIGWCHFISSQEAFEQTDTQKAISNQIILEFLICQL